jgi:hypothetical protein
VTPLLFHWPHWTYSISWLWTNPVSYNFWSSGWGETLLEIFKLGILFLLLRPLYQRISRRVHMHLDCHIDGCERIGHPVHGTGYRACHEHHPAVAHTPGEAITAEHIAQAHAAARR